MARAKDAGVQQAMDSRPANNYPWLRRRYRSKPPIGLHYWFLIGLTPSAANSVTGKVDLVQPMAMLSGATADDRRSLPFGKSVQAWAKHRTRDQSGRSHGAHQSGFGVAAGSEPTAGEEGACRGAGVSSNACCSSLRIATSSRSASLGGALTRHSK